MPSCSSKHGGPYGSSQQLSKLDYYECPDCKTVIKDRYGMVPKVTSAEPQVDCIDNVEYSEKFKTVTITFTDGSSQVLNKPSAHDLFISLGEILGIDWHS